MKRIKMGKMKPETIALSIFILVSIILFFEPFLLQIRLIFFRYEIQAPLSIGEKIYFLIEDSFIRYIKPVLSIGLIWLFCEALCKFIKAAQAMIDKNFKNGM